MGKCEQNHSTLHNQNSHLIVDVFETLKLSAMTYKNLTEEQRTEAKEAFQLVDKEGSGFIKTKEVGIVLRALGHNPSEEDLEKLLAGKEDSVNLNDFLEMLSAEVNDDMNDEELRVAFKVFDREGQGWISGAELRFMLANMGEKMSYDEVDMVLDEAGIDGDGKFRYNDFVDRLNSDN